MASLFARVLVVFDVKVVWAPVRNEPVGNHSSRDRRRGEPGLILLRHSATRERTLATMALCMSTSAFVAKAVRPAVRASAEEKVSAAMNSPRIESARPMATSLASDRPFSPAFHLSDRSKRRRPPLTDAVHRFHPQPSSVPKRVTNALAAAALSASIALAGPVSSANAEIRLPPLDPDPERCERAYVGNTIGQANAVSDRILDLRKCTFTGKDLSTKTLSGALMVDADFKGANMTEVVMSKAYAVGADFTGANFTNSVVDRVTFDGANLSGCQLLQRGHHRRHLRGHQPDGRAVRGGAHRQGGRQEALRQPHPRERDQVPGRVQELDA